MMPSISTTLAMSSVSIVRNTKDKDASMEEADPLLMHTKLISPTLSPAMKRAEVSGISFYMVLYLDKSSTAVPQLTMEFSRDGQVLGSGSPELDKPDKDNRIQYVATVPSGSLDPGEYTIRFIATQGSEVAEDTASFTLQ